MSDAAAATALQDPGTPAPVLAFDTSTERLAVALQAGACALTRLAQGGAAASAALLPLVHTLLAEAGLTLRDVGTFAFGRGPGAFTGLRTACAVAQGLGFGLARPVLPIDSLLVVAEDARVQAAGGDMAMPFDVLVAMDARMDEVYAARYRWQPQAGAVGGGRWQVLQAPALYALPALADPALTTAPAAAGSALAAFGARLALPSACWRLEAEHDRAAALLRLAVAAAARGEGVDAADALPLYLRDSVALTTAERAAARAAAGAAP
jgi:tRNA threonylcarbamoyladenosine biosynthesis protein TsaB